MYKKKVLKKKAKKKLLKKNLANYPVPISKQVQAEPVPKGKDAILLAKSDLLAGQYCNVALIKHTPREFIFDFLLLLGEEHILVSRVITNPKHAKKIHEVLGSNIAKFEKKFGKIKD